MISIVLVIFFVVISIILLLIFIENKQIKVFYISTVILLFAFYLLFLYMGYDDYCDNIAIIIIGIFTATIICGIYYLLLYGTMYVIVGDGCKCCQGGIHIE